MPKIHSIYSVQSFKECPKHYISYQDFIRMHFRLFTWLYTTILCYLPQVMFINNMFKLLVAIYFIDLFIIYKQPPYYYTDDVNTNLLYTDDFTLFDIIRLHATIKNNQHIALNSFIYQNDLNDIYLYICSCVED